METAPIIDRGQGTITVRCPYCEDAHTHGDTDLAWRPALCNPMYAYRPAAADVETAG